MVTNATCVRYTLSALAGVTHLLCGAIVCKTTAATNDKVLGRRQRYGTDDLKVGVERKDLRVRLGTAVERHGGL